MPHRDATLMGLPTELRLMIYGFALTHTETLQLRNLVTDPNQEVQVLHTQRGILLACTQTYQEAHNIPMEIRIVHVLLDGPTGTHELELLLELVSAVRSVVIEVIANNYVITALQQLIYQVADLGRVIDQAPLLTQLTIVFRAPGMSRDICDATLSWFSLLSFQGQTTITIDTWDPVRGEFIGEGASNECIQQVTSGLRHGRSALGRGSHRR